MEGARNLFNVIHYNVIEKNRSLYWHIVNLLNFIVSLDKFKPCPSK